MGTVSAVCISFGDSGLGNTLIPLASGIAEFVMRVSVALLLPKLIGEDGIFLCGNLCLDQRSCFIIYKLYDYYTKIQRIRFRGIRF